MSTSLQNNIKTLYDLIDRRGRFFFVGICGISMSALAEYLYVSGSSVSGSDTGWRSDSRLATLGIQGGRIGDRVAIENSDAVIVSNAIPADAPDLVVARASGVPIFSRAELLGAIMLAWKHRIGISGSHGKSTTTAMLHTILTLLDRSPTTFSGAPLITSMVSATTSDTIIQKRTEDTFSLGGESSTAPAYFVGRGDIFVYESCEYKNSFLAFSPTTSVINALELDHTDFFHTDEELLYSFYLSTKSAECVIINTDYPLARRLLEMLKGKRVVTVGSFGADYTYRAESTETGIRCFITYQGDTYSATLPIHGEYNAMNVASAVAAARDAGIAIGDSMRALESFAGTPGRLEEIGSLGGRRVILDYAHHPTEIRLSIASLLARFSAPTIVFRPHTYTRTRDLFSSFVDALSPVTRLIVTDTYAAREEYIPGASATDLAAALPSAEYVPLEMVVEHLMREGSTLPIVLMGAGDFSIVRDKIKG